MSETVHKTLEGRVALVTGASSGIGRACAVALAERGASVAVNYSRDADGANETVYQCEAVGAKAFALVADVSDETEVTNMVARTVAAYGALDVAVANAGIQKDGALTDLTKDDWDSVIAVNLTGVFLTIQAAVRQFRRQGERGARARGNIVVMSSVHDVIPWAGHVNYAAAKGGVAMLMKSAAQELAAERIRVNSVSPGAIATAINRDVWSDETSADALRELIPYGRIGEPKDVGEAVAWLASDASDYVTGHSLVVDGGMMLYPEFRDNG